MYNQHQSICISKFFNPMFIPSLITISSKSLGPFPWRHWTDSATSKACLIIFPSGLFMSVIRADVFMPSLFPIFT